GLLTARDLLPLPSLAGIGVALPDESRRGAGLQGGGRPLRRLEEVHDLEALGLGEALGPSIGERGERRGQALGQAGLGFGARPLIRHHASPSTSVSNTCST